MVAMRVGQRAACLVVSWAASWGDCWVAWKAAWTAAKKADQ